METSRSDTRKSTIFERLSLSKKIKAQDDKLIENAD